VVVSHIFSKEYFYSLGGVSVLVKLLWICYSVKRVRLHEMRGGFAYSKSVIKGNHIEREAIINESLALLREICFSVRGIAEQIASDNEFVISLFTKMKTPVLFDNAVGLAEELISYEEERIFDLSSIRKTFTYAL